MIGKLYINGIDANKFPIILTYYVVPNMWTQHKNVYIYISIIYMFIWVYFCPPNVHLIFFYKPIILRKIFLLILHTPILGYVNFHKPLILGF